MNKKHIQVSSICIPLFVFILLICRQAAATHIRAGEITVRRISNVSLTYEVTVIGYTDTGSPIQFGAGEISLGDGTVQTLEEVAQTRETRPLANEVAYNRFVFTHTYPAPGSYSISYLEAFRNAGVVNMTGSVNTPFFLQTNLVIDPAYRLNSSPVLLVPPVDRAVVGARFIHNPGAFDPDGDSIAYRIWFPKRDRDDSVFNYLSPNDREFYRAFDYNRANQDKNKPPSFTLDSLSGDLEWDAPGQEGEYNIALIVEEWRQLEGKWRLIGEVTRDMQIIVVASNNKPPELMVPEDICVEAGTLVSGQVTGLDPEGTRVLIEAFSGIFDIAEGNVTMLPDPAVYQSSPGVLDFTWQTDCSHIRKRPYEIRFKVTDESSDPDVNVKLVNFKTWRITVVPPAPRELVATTRPDRKIGLRWSPYNCRNAESIQIWRRVDSFAFEPQECELGLPANAGYTLIDTVDAEVHSYVDDNSELGLDAEANYCYRLVAIFPEPDGGISYASAESCALIAGDAPVIARLSVLNTSPDNGKMEVAWTSSFADNDSITDPAVYEVFRAVGFSGSAQRERLGTTTDTVWVDSGLNTLDMVYNYQVRLVNPDGTPLDSSAVASSVRLGLEESLESFTLSWDFDVPWSNAAQHFPQHFIYRNQVDANSPGNFRLIGEANVLNGGFFYVDSTGLQPETAYCYYVTTQGSYGNPAIFSPLQNNSQEICGYLADLQPPCPPAQLAFDETLSCRQQIATTPCHVREFTNRLLWQKDAAGGCDQDVVGYNVYFSDSGDEGTFELISQVDEPAFTHAGLSSFKGCYRISAFDRFGNESGLSDQICGDNCPYFELPNVFTPNGDGNNDLFTPYYSDGSLQRFDFSRCMRFVKEVDFRVFDRSGGRVFHTSSGDVEGTVFINWDGRSDAGTSLPEGVYYYTAEVEYDVLSPENSHELFNGWVHIMR